MFGILTVEMVLAYMFLATVMTENCYDRYPRWSCNDNNADFAAVGFVAHSRDSSASA